VNVPQAATPLILGDALEGETVEAGKVPAGSPRAAAGRDHPPPGPSAGLTVESVDDFRAIPVTRHSGGMAHREA